MVSRVFVRLSLDYFVSSERLPRVVLWLDRVTNCPGNGTRDSYSTPTADRDSYSTPTADRNHICNSTATADRDSNATIASAATRRTATATAPHRDRDSTAPRSSPTSGRA
jgi:hypothetical protein